MSAPYQTCRAAEHTQIHQLDHMTILDHRQCSTSLAIGPLPSCLDMGPNRSTQHVVDTDNGDAAETNKQLAHDSRVGFNRGSPF